jgi:hypothetical protein
MQSKNAGSACVGGLGFPVLVGLRPSTSLVVYTSDMAMCSVNRNGNGVMGNNDQQGYSNWFFDGCPGYGQLGNLVEQVYQRAQSLLSKARLGIRGERQNANGDRGCLCPVEQA